MCPNYSEWGAAISFQVGAVKVEGENPNCTPAPFTSLHRVWRYWSCGKRGNNWQIGGRHKRRRSSWNPDAGINQEREEVWADYSKSALMKWEWDGRYPSVEETWLHTERNVSGAPIFHIYRSLGQSILAWSCGRCTCCVSMADVSRWWKQKPLLVTLQNESSRCSAARSRGEGSWAPPAQNWPRSQMRALQNQKKRELQISFGSGVFD